MPDHHHNLPPEPYKVTYIDGAPYAAILPIVEEDPDVFDDLNYMCLARHLEKKHAISKLNAAGVASLTMTPTLDPSDGKSVKIITIGGLTPTCRDLIDADVLSNCIGYRPVLAPLCSCEDATDLDLLSEKGFKNGDMVTLGTLYLNGDPVKVPKNPVPNGDITSYPGGAVISFGDTSENPDEQLHWFCMDGFLICDRVVLVNVSWLQLNAQNLVYGFDDDDDDEDVLYSESLQDDIWDKLLLLDIPKLELLNNLIDDLIDL